MKNTFDFRKQLWTSFEARMQRNSSYSLRAFARDLNISVSTLSKVMNKKRDLSSQMAEKISKKLGLSSSQARLFVASAVAQSSRIAQMRLRSKKHLRAQEVPKLAPQKIIAKNIPFELTWRHLALREFITLPDFTPTKGWLSKNISLPEKQALAIWEECISTGYIVQAENGSYEASEHLNFVGEKNDKNTVLKNLYRDILEKSNEKIDSPREQRDLSMSMLSLTKQQYLDLIKMVRLFCSETTRNFKKDYPDEKEWVVCWATQIFKI